MPTSLKPWGGDPSAAGIVTLPWWVGERCSGGAWWRDETRPRPAPSSPLPGRDHQPRRLAVPYLLPELAGRRADAGRTRRGGFLRNDPALVPQVRPDLRQPAAAAP